MMPSVATDDEQEYGVLIERKEPTHFKLINLTCGASGFEPKVGLGEKTRMGYATRGDRKLECKALESDPVCSCIELEGRRGLAEERVVARGNKSSEPRLNLSGSWQQGHSAAYNTLLLIQVVYKWENAPRCGRLAPPRCGRLAPPHLSTLTWFKPLYKLTHTKPSFGIY